MDLGGVQVGLAAGCSERNSASDSSWLTGSRARSPSMPSWTAARSAGAGAEAGAGRGVVGKESGTSEMRLPEAGRTVRSAPELGYVPAFAP